MDRQASARSDLELMLIDESKEPKALPLSLLEKITNGFSSDNEIGRGGFATVYKGTLDNGMVAVKRLSSAHLHETEFYREVKCLLKVKHRNIVRFLGYCADTQGNMHEYNSNIVMADVQEKLLCFEYVPKGSLRDYIKDASEGLEWRERYQIIKGICEGLHYLHQSPIVHLDLKPENILLDGNMFPKITDFGLSRCFDQNQIRATISKVVGTQGYMAPEFYGVKFTLKSDIYSLGIIIREILTGERGYTKDEDILGSWRNRLEESQRNRQLEQIWVCAKLSMECIDFIPEKRPDSRIIIRRLDKTERMDGSDETHLSSSSATQVTESWTGLENSQGDAQQLDTPLDESEELKVIPLSLLRDITHNFSDGQKIGSGGFAAVYKGILGNRMVAVKKLFIHAAMCEENFQHEIKCLMKAKHKNLVELLGYCAETVRKMKMIGHNGDLVMADIPQRLLCFEYLPKGSLHNYITDASKGLEWSQRYHIMKAICYGLHHLHRNCIVHLDLKPDHILLDDNMVPKIIDFGLSRCFGVEQTRTIASSISGTYGYLAPEFLGHGLITYKSDLYGLGVIFMELLTGEKGYTAVDKILESWRNRLDRTLGDTRLEQVRVCAHIAVQCCDANPEKRPSAKHILDRLDETERAGWSTNTGPSSSSSAQRNGLRREEAEAVEEP